MVNNDLSGSRYHYGGTPWMKVKKRAPLKSVGWRKQGEGWRLFLELKWKVSNELYLREDRGRWLEEMIQSSSSSDSQKAIGVEYSQH